MEKLYGYKEKDVLGLIELVNHNNANLSKVFKDYALASGKSKGTIRNLYYAIVRKSNEDKEFCDKYLNGKPIKVETKQEFNKIQEKELIEKVLKAKAKGKSVRSTISELANGNEKLALRYQNKYRALAKKKDKSIMDIKEQIEKNQGISLDLLPRTNFNSFQEKRVKSEIDKLVSRISLDINNENQILKQKIAVLEKENSVLKEFFGISERSKGIIV